MNHTNIVEIYWIGNDIQRAQDSGMIVSEKNFKEINEKKNDSFKILSSFQSSLCFDKDGDQTNHHLPHSLLKKNDSWISGL